MKKASVLTVVVLLLLVLLKLLEMADTPGVRSRLQGWIDRWAGPSAPAPAAAETPEPTTTTPPAAAPQQPPATAGTATKAEKKGEPLFQGIFDPPHRSAKQGESGVKANENQ